ncbi:MAG TPA: YfiR family protein [Labilithrix sp.]|nr:YfiR family protein [Labilithrix sp.]
MHLFARPVAADPVPARIQASLVAKLLSFDRNLPTRAAGRVKILVLVDPSEGQSQRVANEFVGELKGHRDIAGMPVEVLVAPYSDPASTAARIRQERISAIYLSVGLSRSAPMLADALKDVGVMTVANESKAVSRGVAIGFELEGGRPKILISLTHAKAQSVALPASVLSLATIVEGDR